MNHSSNVKEAIRQTKDDAENDDPDVVSDDTFLRATVTVSKSAFKATMRKWRKELACNEDQEEVVKIVEKQMKAEYNDLIKGRQRATPKCLLVTGGPGTGKSFVSDSLRQLFEKLGWVHGVQFEIAALQAVVADMLGGETLHRTCKVAFGRNQTGAENKKNGRHLRWLIIDEISQVSAELLGWYGDTRLHHAYTTYTCLTPCLVGVKLTVETLSRWGVARTSSKNPMN